MRLNPPFTLTNELTPEAVVKMYKQLGVELGKVAVKVHSGEDGNRELPAPLSS